MSGAGQFDRRVILQQRGLDANGDRLGAWSTVATRDARIISLTGGEGVQTARLEGSQPVIIYVRRETALDDLDNSWRAQDYRNADTIWGIASKIWNRDTDEIEIMAVEKLNGSDA